MFIDGVNYDELDAERRAYRAEVVAEVEAEEWSAALAINAAFDEQVFAVLETAQDGTRGIHDEGTGLLQQVMAGTAQLDRMRDEAEVERPSGWIEDVAEAQTAALAEYSAREGVRLCPRHQQPEVAAGICAVYGRLERADLRLLVDGYHRRLTQAQLFADSATASECEATIRELRYHLDADRAPETQSA